VAHDLRARVAEILELRVSDPRLRGLTVQSVEITPDFSIAKVYVSSLGSVEDAMQALEKAGPFVRRCLAEDLTMRRVPELRFHADTSLERAARIDAILREIEQDRAEHPGGENGDPEGEEPA
jgi:ribosome-binding factor A